MEPEKSRRELYAQTSKERRDVGVLSIRAPLRGRYYTQAEASAWTRTRLRKWLPTFETHTDFVEFAIECARERNLPPPNRQRRMNDSGMDAWDVTRIERILASLMRGGNSRTKTLNFFNSAIDELEGLRFYRIQEEKAAANDLSDDEQEEPDEPNGVVMMHSRESLLEGDWREELAQLYVNVLIDRVIASEELDLTLLDRIERILTI